MRKLAAGALVAGLFAMGAGTAVAASWHDMPTLSTGGAKLHHGEYAWHPAGTHHGAFEWKGKLQDADHGDGHNVYMQVKVEGYDWSRYNGKQKKTVSSGRATGRPRSVTPTTRTSASAVTRVRSTLITARSTKHYKR